MARGTSSSARRARMKSSLIQIQGTINAFRLAKCSACLVKVIARELLCVCKSATSMNIFAIFARFIKVSPRIDFQAAITRRSICPSHSANAESYKRFSRNSDSFTDMSEKTRRTSRLSALSRSLLPMPRSSDWIESIACNASKRTISLRLLRR